MGALELLSGQVTAPDTTLTALTMNAGNSLTIRNTPVDTRIWLLQAWVKAQGAGVLRIRSPQLHDNVQGVRLRTVVGEVDPLLPMGAMQRLQTQDQLVVELSGSATAGDIETASLLVYYETLPGIEMRRISAQELRERMVNLVTVENTLSAGTAGGYSGEEAIDAEFDLLRANTDYALVGYHVSTICGAVRYRGVDFGNLGVGGPGNAASKQLTGSWFKILAEVSGFDLVPVFNSANKSGLLLDVHQDEDGADPVVSTILAQLAA